MTDDRECPACHAIRCYLEMRLVHLQVLRECTFCRDASLVARKNELHEIEAVMDGKEPEIPWTACGSQRAGARAGIKASEEDDG